MASRVFGSEQRFRYMKVESDSHVACTTINYCSHQTIDYHSLSVMVTKDILTPNLNRSIKHIHRETNSYIDSMPTHHENLNYSFYFFKAPPRGILDMLSFLMDVLILFGLNLSSYFFFGW